MFWMMNCLVTFHDLKSFHPAICHHFCNTFIMEIVLRSNFILA